VTPQPGRHLVVHHLGYLRPPPPGESHPEVTTHAGYTRPKRPAHGEAPNGAGTLGGTTQNPVKRGSSREEPPLIRLVPGQTNSCYPPSESMISCAASISGWPCAAVSFPS
jgi:hypothetical protein